VCELVEFGQQSSRWRTRSMVDSAGAALPAGRNVIRTNAASSPDKKVGTHRWEFRRTPDGWCITRRVNHVIDGGPEARDLLNRGLD
jgi:hypothetical protein